MSVVILPQANRVIKQFGDFADVDSSFSDLAAFTAAAPSARIPDGWEAWCKAEKKWYTVTKDAQGAVLAIEPRGGTNKDYVPFTANTDVAERKIVSGSRFSFATTEPITTAANMGATWTMVRNTGKGYFLSRSAFLQNSRNGSANTVSTATITLRNDAEIFQFVINIGIYDLTFATAESTSFLDFPVKFQLDISANTRLRSVVFPAAAGFEGPMPTIVDKTYDTRTIIEWDFFCKENGLGVRKWYYTPSAASGGTVTNGDTEVYLKALPGYSDPNNTYLMKDSNGFFYWGAGEVAPVNTAPYINNQINTQSGTVGDSITLPLAGTFIDAENNPLSYGVTSGNPALVGAGIDGSNLLLDLNGEGSINVTLRATDTGGLYADMVFTVNVAQPTPTNVYTTSTGDLYTNSTNENYTY